MSKYVTFEGIAPLPEPPVCPECSGRCCRDELHYSGTHMSAEYCAHVCDYCHDGTVPEPVRTAEDEREDVLAYLSYAREFPFHYDKTAPAILDVLRDLIRQGTHVGWAKRNK